MTGFGVPALVISPNQPSNAQPGTPDSTTVGRFGNADEHLLLLTLTARTLPALICGDARIAGAKVISSRPETISVIASAKPLKGTCTILIPAVLWKSSPLICEFEPMPADVKLNVPGFALASATSSFTFFAGRDGWTIRMFGMSASGVMPAKSFTGSNGSLL